jgi:hypothetical protein
MTSGKTTDRTLFIFNELIKNYERSKTTADYCRTESKRIV